MKLLVEMRADLLALYHDDPALRALDHDFRHLLDWLEEAQLDRVGCFQYENVAGARSNALPNHVAPEVKQDRWDRFMAKAQAIRKGT